MKNVLLSAALLLAATPAIAQDLPVARLDSQPVAQAAPDTVAAIHRLFAGRRLRRNVIASSLGAGVLVGGAISGSSESDGARSSGGSGYGGAGISFSGTDYLVLYAIPAVPLILTDFIVYSQYSRKNEARAIAAFQAHQLSTKLRRKLKSRYFR